MSNLLALPEEIILMILSNLDDVPNHTAQYIMFHVCKQLFKTTNKWFDDKLKENYLNLFLKCKYDDIITAKKNVLIWASKFKRKNLDLIKWVESFKYNVCTTTCFYNAIKNNNLHLLKYLIIKYGATEELLSYSLYQEKVEIYKELIKMGNERGIYELQLGRYTLGMVTTAMADRGYYHMLKNILDNHSFYKHSEIFRSVLLSKFIDVNQKIKIMKLLIKYRFTDDASIYTKLLKEQNIKKIS